MEADNEPFGKSIVHILKPTAITIGLHMKTNNFIAFAKGMLSFKDD